MISQDLINRINELSKKKKTVGLTEEEVKEQKKLYKEYLEGFRENFKKQLDHIDILDPKKVLLGLSGGVDSATAAIKLKDAGFDVTGYYFDVVGNNEKGLKEAREVARNLNIELISEDVSSEFNDLIINNFSNEYINGRTPNPCIICNPLIKFKKLIDVANRIGAYYIATGHYARIGKSDDKYFICKSLNIEKDQSYMLYRLDQETIKRTIFPLGEFQSKTETRELAKDSKLENADKKDSMDICFLDANQNYVKFLEKKGITSLPGKFVDSNGNVLGEHKGIINYTLGQRKGLGIALGKPVFVTNINTENNEITLGDNEDLMTNKVISTDNFVSAYNLNDLDGLSVEAKVRYSAKPAVATLTVNNNEVISIFKEKQRAVTPGQSIVFYIDDKVIGGGFIK